MRYANPTEDDVRRNASLLGGNLRRNKYKKIRGVMDKTMDRHFDGRRKGILDKAGASDSGYVTSGLKRGTYARDDADYKLTGRDSMSNRQFLGTQRRASARVDQAHAYEQARNRGMTPTQAKRASAGVEKSRLQSSAKKKNTQGQGKMMSRNRVSDVMVNRAKKGVGHGADKTAAAIAMTQSGRKKKSDRLVAKKKTVKGRAKNVADIPTRTKANIATKTAVSAHSLKRKVAKKKTR